MPIEYAPEAAAQLDTLENSADDQTWDAICDALELIDQLPDSAQARREEITGSNSATMWKVSVRSSSVDHLAVLWNRGSAGDYVVFIGAMPIARQ